MTSQKNVHILDLNNALEELSIEDERLAQVVELRFFAGMTIEETASALEIGTATVKRDLKMARAYLIHRLKHQAPVIDE